MMRCLLHQLRRPTVILAGVYLAGAGVLAGTLSPRPLAEFRARLTDDQHYELVGLSPDGRMVATTQGGTGLDGRNVPPSEPARSGCGALRTPPRAALRRASPT